MLVEAEECCCVRLQKPSSSTWLSMYLCNLPVCVSVHTLCTTVCFCAYLCMGIYAYLCMYSCVSACLSVSTPVSEWVYTSLCINTCMYTCFLVHTVLREWDMRKPVLSAKKKKIGWSPTSLFRALTVEPVCHPLLIARLFQVFLWGLGVGLAPSCGVSTYWIIFSSQSPTLLKPRILSTVQPLPVGNGCAVICCCPLWVTGGNINWLSGN